MNPEEQRAKELERIWSGLRPWIRLYQGAEFAYLAFQKDQQSLQIFSSRLTLTVGTPRSIQPSAVGPFCFGVLPCMLETDPRRPFSPTVTGIIEGAQAGTIMTHFPGAMSLGGRPHVSYWRRQSPSPWETGWPREAISISGDEHLRSDSYKPDWSVLEGSLLSGACAGFPSVEGVAGLVRKLGFHNNPKEVDYGELEIVAPLCFRAGAVTGNDLQTSLVIEAPVMADANTVTVALFGDEEAPVLLETLAAPGWTRQPGDDGIATFTKIVRGGPGQMRRCHVVFGDRPIAKCNFAHASEAEHVYTSFDPGHEALERALLHTKKSSEFESACGALLSLVGFRTIPSSHVGETGDLLATTSHENNAGSSEHECYQAMKGMWLLVECSLAPKHKSHVRHLGSLARAMGERTGTQIQPVVMSRVTGSGLSAVVRAAMETEGVAWIGGEELGQLLNLARNPQDPKRFPAALRLMGLESQDPWGTAFLFEDDDEAQAWTR